MKYSQGTNTKGLKALAGLASLGLALAIVSGPASAGYISPATEGGVVCGNTVSFGGSKDCVGQVTDPKNDAAGTLLTYLNQTTLTFMITGGTPLSSDGVDWGIVGAWDALTQIEGGNGTIGDNGDEVFTTAGTSGGSLTGDWTFTAATGDVITYLAVTVKDGAGWSAYYYDLTGQNLTTYTNTWDTLGLTNASGGTGPDVSHMQVAYITDTAPGPGPGPSIPEPTPLALIALGAFLLRWSSRKARA